MTEAEAALKRRLAKMQWFATSLFVAVTILFVVTRLLLPSYPWLGVVVAFAEAGMIGALADWFAVTALFRRPLGLPIPHTAIVPTRKKDIGEALARFIHDHFLTKSAVLPRLEQADLAARLGGWLTRNSNAHLVSRDLGFALDWLLDAIESAELRNSLQESLRRALEQASVSAGFSVVLEIFMSGDHQQALINQLVDVGRNQLRENEENIRARIKDSSPWWLPRLVDEEIYTQLVSKLQGVLDEIGDDPAHPARADFNRRLVELCDRLRDDPVAIERGEILKNEFLGHPAVQAYLDELWNRIRGYMSDSLHEPDSPIRLGIERELVIVGGRLQEDTEINERLNGWLRDLVTYLVETYRQPLSEIVSDTIDQWDPTATSERIELYIGRDLQFIRINGTLVGGLVGIFIYAVWGVLPI